MTFTLNKVERKKFSLFFESVDPHLTVGENDAEKEIKFNLHNAPFNSISQLYGGRFFISNRSMNVSSDSMSATIIASVDRLTNEEHRQYKTAFHRAVKLIDKPLNLRDCIQTNNITILFDNRVSKNSSISVKLGTNSFDLTSFQVYNSNYLLIESYDKLQWEDFRDCVYAIMKGYALISGFLAFEDLYYFSYSTTKKDTIEGFAYYSERGDIYSHFPIITTNPYSKVQNQSIHEESFNKMKPVSSEIFSELCLKSMAISEFETAILTYVEASTATLLLRVQSYFVILETLANLFKESKKQQKSSLKLKKKVLRELRKTIQSTDLDGEGKSFFEKKIDNLNQQPNSERLEDVFSHIGIELLEEDKEIIKRRNDYLHGRLYKLEDTRENREENDRDLLYVTMRMCTILAALMIKAVGYSGWIINHPKIWEVQTKKFIDEKHFRKI